MTLGEVELGRQVVVERVGGERAFRRRLMELGVVPGTTMTVEKIAPLGDPIEIRARGCSLSIRMAEARAIEVVAAAVAERAPREAADLAEGVPAERLAPDPAGE
jgi:Fe2+ transport system protein FeoA